MNVQNYSIKRKIVNFVLKVLTNSPKHDIIIASKQGIGCFNTIRRHIRMLQLFASSIREPFRAGPCGTS